MTDPESAWLTDVYKPRDTNLTGVVPLASGVIAGESLAGGVTAVLISMHGIPQ